MAGAYMSDRFLDSLDAFFCRGLTLSSCRSDTDEIVFQGPYPSEKIIDHHLEILPYPGKQIDEDDSVDTSVRMITYDNKRSGRELREYLRIDHLIIYAYFLKHR